MSWSPRRRCSRSCAARPGGPCRRRPAGARCVRAPAGALALERAEYRIRGARYKVPRLVREELAGRRRSAAAPTSSPRARARARRGLAARCSSASTRWSPATAAVPRPDGPARQARCSAPGTATRSTTTRSSSSACATTLAEHPAVILPSHKSNLDGLVVPGRDARERAAAGAHVRRHQHGVLADRRRSSAAPGGSSSAATSRTSRSTAGCCASTSATSSRSGSRSSGTSRAPARAPGKLGPPKMGLLRYIADACREGRTDDVAMVPVSIIYDQLHEVGEYAAEATGAAKKAESLGWVVKSSSPRQRRQRGRIYVRFGEPISLRDADRRRRRTSVHGRRRTTSDCRSSASRSAPASTRSRRSPPARWSAWSCWRPVGGRSPPASCTCRSTQAARAGARARLAAGRVGRAARHRGGRAPCRRVARRERHDRGLRRR